MAESKILHLQFRKYTPIGFGIYYIFYVPAFLFFTFFFYFLLFILISFIFEYFEVFQSFFNFIGSSGSRFMTDLFWLISTIVVVCSFFIGVVGKGFKKYNTKLSLDTQRKSLLFEVNGIGYENVKFTRCLWFFPFAILRHIGKYRIPLPVFAAWLHYETLDGAKGYILLEDNSFCDIKVSPYDRYGKVVGAENYSQVISLLSDMKVLPKRIYQKYTWRIKTLPLFKWVLLVVCLLLLILSKV